MKILNGSELAGFIKERQAHQVRSLDRTPKLLILRDNDNPVIQKYVELKIKYGHDIGIEVEDYITENTDDLKTKLHSANQDPVINGIIIQLPLKDKTKTDSICDLISPTKDVDGLGINSLFDSATATAILWLIAGYDIKLDQQKIALVGLGKLVGAPLLKMLTDSNYHVTGFEKGDNLTELNQYDVIISATGTPKLITDSMIKPGAVLIDAGTASEDGVLKGDVADEVRNRKDLTAITPVKGGVGPLTVSCLFDHVIQSSQN